MRYIGMVLVLITFFVIGGAAAHYSLPEKGRLTKEEAQHMLDKRYHVMGYMRQEDIK